MPFPHSTFLVENMPCCIDFVCSRRTTENRHRSDEFTSSDSHLAVLLPNFGSKTVRPSAIGGPLSYELGAYTSNKLASEGCLATARLCKTDDMFALNSMTRRETRLPSRHHSYIGFFAGSAGVVLINNHSSSAPGRQELNNVRSSAGCPGYA